MARPIGVTPTLDGEDATEFLKKMKEPPTKEEKEIDERINKQRKVYF